MLTQGSQKKQQNQYWAEGWRNRLSQKKTTEDNLPPSFSIHKLPSFILFMKLKIRSTIKVFPTADVI